MDRLLIQGKYSTYGNEKESNIPMERKRDIREDASWYKKSDTVPDISVDQMLDIRYEHKAKGISITDSDVFSKMIGEPTHPIVRELLNAEYQYKVDREIRKTHGGKSWIESIMAPDAIFFEPLQAPLLVERRPLKDLIDNELLKIMFLPFKLFASKYSGDLEKQFRKKSGVTLDLDPWAKWPNRKTTHLDDLLAALKSKIQIAYRGGLTQDVTPEIQANWIDFSNVLTRQEWMAFGGIQEVELKGYLSKVKQAGKGDYFDKSGKVHHEATILEVRLEFVIKDWFGVDEEDVYKNTMATQLVRDSLMAFWILQHQRGFKPFINVIRYKEKKEYSF
jgi:hypothetical protein